MLRHLTSLLLACSIIAPAYAAEYRDPDGRFHMTLPDGWKEEKIDDRRVMTFAVAKDETGASPFGAICLGMFMDMPNTRKATQEELNDAMQGQLTAEFWEKAMKSSDDSFKMKVDDAGSRQQSGRTVHFVAYTGTGTETGKSQSAKGKMEMHLVPGSMHFVMCMSMVQHYEAASADFTTIFTSYEPHRDTVVSSFERPAPSVLTMFAKANFKGAARVLNQDTANLAAAGWPTLGASLTVDGAEPWQVCSGVDFTGACQVIMAAETNPTLVRSARRIPGNTNIEGIVATATRRAFSHPATRKLTRH